MMRKWVWICAIFVAAAGTCAQGDGVIDATVCTILADPVAYNGKMVRVRGRIVTGFEFFDIRGKECGQPINSITLSYPDDPRVKPAPSFSLQRDAEFKRFRPYLTQKVSTKRKDGVRFECDRYEITAMILGRLDGVEKAGIIEDESGKVIAVEGFGHLNRYRARLVIQSVSEIVAKDISAACR